MSAQCLLYWSWNGDTRTDFTTGSSVFPLSVSFQTIPHAHSVIYDRLSVTNIMVEEEGSSIFLRNAATGGP